MVLLIFVIIGLIAACIAWSFKGYKETIDVRGKSIFISGCDSGFGHDLALRLDKQGAKVFAACLTSKGAVDLRSKASSQLEALVCDITKQEDIDTAAKVVASISPEGLWALVNNAGIAFTGEWDWLPEKYFRQVMEVNFFAHVAVTKTFLAQIKKTKGRIINLTSAFGFLSFSDFGPYACSKHAMEAFSDSLRREMRKWGISVFVVEPWFYATPIVLTSKGNREKIWNELDEKTKAEYGPEYGQFYVSGSSGVTLGSVGSADEVLDVVQSKIIGKYPIFRSRVGKVATITYIIQSFLPTSWADTLYNFAFKKSLPAALKK
eukprot:Phypoly_transcript_01390.p1 GENE.Phypoly_transcript_01390~~Phypoly_transcript_01390.p1  ORF type:complete len:320 (+),score=37.22 Phypoly_transcript_01390:1220-2179(+)